MDEGEWHEVGVFLDNAGCALKMWSMERERVTLCWYSCYLREK